MGVFLLFPFCFYAAFASGLYFSMDRPSADVFVYSIPVGVAFFAAEALVRARRIARIILHYREIPIKKEEQGEEA